MRIPGGRASGGWGAGAVSRSVLVINGMSVSHRIGVVWEEGVGGGRVIGRYSVGARPVVSPVQDCAIGSIPSTSPQLHNVMPVLNMNMTGNNNIRHIDMALSGFMFLIRTLFLFRPLTARRFYLGEMRVVASFPSSLLSNIISL